MLKKIVIATLFVIAVITVQGGCKKDEKVVAIRSDYQVPITSKEIVVPRVGLARVDDPPCIRRGMEDVATISKSFAAQPKAQSFAFVGKDIPAAPVTLGDPQIAGGPSIMIQGVDETLGNIGAEGAKALAAGGYSSCGTIAFLLPEHATQVRVVLTAGNSQESRLPCTTAQGPHIKCDVDMAAWTWFREDRYVVATFKNWSDVGRTAKIDLFP